MHNELERFWYLFFFASLFCFIGLAFGAWPGFYLIGTMYLVMSYVVLGKLVVDGLEEAYEWYVSSGMIYDMFEDVVYKTEKYNDV